ncbi:MAG: hypothetical protein K8T10_01390 [Candidatus Eremiobacteraeota bacterium]|nr:hypothetical protein [Candidatus Eremiobacteraeota bacterium]
MNLKIDGYTKFILTVIAIALILNAAAVFINKTANPTPVYAGENQMKITDIRTTYPLKVEISNWPREYKVEKR